MSNLSVFTFENNQVRIEFIKNEPWFCLVDICKILDLQNTSWVKKRLDESYLSTTKVTTPYGLRDAIFVAEPNLYRVIFQSKKSEAKKFQDWVFEEVLPQIRKTGSYGQQQLSLEKPKEYPRWVTGWEIDGLHELIHQTAELMPHCSAIAEEAIIMRIKYEIDSSSFVRSESIRQPQFDKASDIVYKIYGEAEKLADRVRREELAFIKHNIKGIDLKL